VAGDLWVTDREPGIRLLFAELMPDAQLLTPDDLRARLALGQQPDQLIIDGTQLLELPTRIGTQLVREVPRLLVCTGLSLAGLPPSILAGPNVAILAKPFCTEDLEAALEWMRGSASPIAPDAFETRPGRPGLPPAALVQRRRPRRQGATRPH